MTDNPYKILLEVGATVAADLDPERSLALIARQVGEALGADSCDINTYDAAADALTYVAVWAKRLRPEDEAYLGTVVPLGTRPARRVALQAREPVAAYLDDPGLDVDRARVHGALRGTRLSGGAAHLRRRCARHPGHRDVRRRGGSFSDAEKRLLQGLAAPAAAAIYNARQFAAVAERRRQLTSLLDAGRAVTSTFGLEDVLGAVAREAAELLGCPECLIYEYDDEHHAPGVAHATTIAARATSGRTPLGTVYPAEDWQDDYELMFAAAPRLQNRDDPLLTASQRAYLAARDLGTTLTVPLRYGDDPIGLLQLLEFGRRRDFGVRELELAAAFGELASAAIHSARLLRRQERQSERLVGLFDASRSMTTALTADDVARVVHEEVVGAMPGERPHVRVWLRDAAGELGRGARTARRPGPPPSSWPRPRPRLLPVQAREDGEARLVVPLAVRGEVLGFIDVLSRRRRYGDELAELLQIVANQAAAAVANARLYARLAEQAITDGLTGLYNHRYFYERLEAGVRARLPLRTAAVAAHDRHRRLQGFNDLHGHVLGDDVLRQVGGILRDGTRRGIDLPARYGGEEFAVILPHTHATGAHVVGGRLQQQIRALAESAGGHAGEVPPEGDGRRARGRAAAP